MGVEGGLLMWLSRRPDALEDALEDELANPSGGASLIDVAKHCPFRPSHAARAISSSNAARADDASSSLESLAGRLMSSRHSSV